ncbi:MAG TPA: hypothetical protein VMN83_23165 [Albitalea sp.]|nr:hypothetical protein [Albitalea sp.]
MIDGPTQGAQAYLSDALGTKFTCVAFSACGDVPPDVARFVANAGPDVKLVRVATRRTVDDGALQDVDSNLTRAYAAENGQVVLVRPDGHVAGRWRKPDDVTLTSALKRARCIAGITEGALS